MKMIMNSIYAVYAKCSIDCITDLSEGVIFDYYGQKVLVISKDECLPFVRVIGYFKDRSRAEESLLSLEKKYPFCNFWIEEIKI